MKQQDADALLLWMDRLFFAHDIELHRNRCDTDLARYYNDKAQAIRDQLHAAGYLTEVRDDRKFYFKRKPKE